MRRQGMCACVSSFNGEKRFSQIFINAFMFLLASFSLLAIILHGYDDPTGLCRSHLQPECPKTTSLY